MKTTLLSSMLLPIAFMGGVVCAQVPADTTIELSTVVVGAKQAASAPYASIRTFQQPKLLAERVEVVKDLSLTVPNVFMPDYGSRMTSAVYVRGLGARMDQSVMGLVVDGIPVFNKNNYDARFGEVVSLSVLRGPQSTLYGRNTMGGVINIRTLSPRTVQGTNLHVDAANGQTLSASLSHYARLNESLYLSVHGFGGRSNGLYTNTYDDSSCDAYQEAGGRFRLEKTSGQTDWMLNVYVGWVDQSGYPYRQRLESGLQPIRYNAPSGYKRLTINEGFTVNRRLGEHILTSTSSYQQTRDDMQLDQDFTADDYFTMHQAQQEHLFSEDMTLQVHDPASRWKSVTGLHLFGRLLTTNAPVTFQRKGIDDLILANANRGMQTVFPNERIEISDSSFRLSSRFSQPTMGIALYNQTSVQVGKWSFHAGLRLDYEFTSLDYDCQSALNYRFSLTMPQFKRLETALDGQSTIGFLELLPSVAATWKPTSTIHVSAQVSKGFKAGGFNTQLFSDILKNAVMSDMMEDMGLYLEGGTDAYDVSEVVTYKPEHSWNVETKVELTPFKQLQLTATGFYIDCRDQQLTVFPAGQNTGRMMTNAGQTRSYGAELEANYRLGLYELQLDYGYTNARFVRYNNGMEDFKGKRVPFAPENTLHASIDRRFSCKGNILDAVTVHAGYRGCGTIWWTEANDVQQPFYSLLDASVSLSRDRYTLQCWGKNLTNTDYDTFYFISMGNAFLQKGRPLQFGATLSISLAR